MFVLIWKDHNADTEVYLFKTEDEAYMFAKDRCEDVYEENGHTVDYTLSQIAKEAGWLFLAQGDGFVMRIEEKFAESSR